LKKCSLARSRLRIVRSGANREHPNMADTVCLLRPGGARPGCCRTTKDAKKFPSPHGRSKVQETALYRFKRVP
jgi:hypothetical protein